MAGSGGTLVLYVFPGDQHPQKTLNSTKENADDGGLQCFLTVPAIIYLTMTPRFPRTRKFANPYVLVAVDLVFCIIWLSAFAAVANWNGTDKCKNACGVAKGVVALGVIIWLVAIRTLCGHLF